MKTILLQALLSLIAFSSFAEDSFKVYVTVAKTGADSTWAKEKCSTLHKILNYNAPVKIETTCDFLAKNDFKSPGLTAAKADHVFYADLRENASGITDLRIVNLKQVDEIDFSQVSWKIQAHEDFNITLSKLFKNLFNYHFNKFAVRAQFAKEAAKDSKKISVVGRDFVDNTLMIPIESEAALVELKTEAPATAKILRATTESLVSLGAGLAWYYKNLEHNKRDWDYLSARESVRSRFQGDGIRFDDNSYKAINEPHAYGGVGYYIFCRSNGLTNLQAFACTFITSLAWESIIEYREVLSIGDQMFTGVGGPYIGESLYQLARFLKFNRNSIASKIVSKILDPGSGLNDFFDRKEKTRPNDRFNQDLFGKFEIYSTLEKSSRNDGSKKDPILVGIKGEVINIADYELEGEISQRISDTAVSTFQAQGSVNGGIPNDFMLLSKVVLAAYHQKKLARDEDGNLRGYNFIIGPAGGMEMRSSQIAVGDEYTDFMGVVNILGPSAQLTLYKGGFKITATMDIFADFAMIRGFALDKYKANEGEVGLATVLQKEDYYYAVGATTRSHIVIEYGRWGAGASLSYGAWQSTNGRYRFQDQITKNIHLNDTRGEVEVYVEYKIMKNLSLRLAVQRIRREGKVQEGGYSEKMLETKYLGTLSYLF